jgi:hypothetical protein
MRKALLMSCGVAAMALLTVVVSSGQYAQAGPLNGSAGC